jgi:hypothetical protein
LVCSALWQLQNPHGDMSSHIWFPEGIPHGSSVLLILQPRLLVQTAQFLA